MMGGKSNYETESEVNSYTYLMSLPYYCYPNLSFQLLFKNCNNASLHFLISMYFK